MWDFRVGEALGLMFKTLPFIWLRLAVYFGITLAYLLVTGMGAGIGWAIGGMGDDGFRASSIFWGGFAGFGIVGAVMYFLREYILYIVKAGHIAVLVELIDKRPLPEGRNQITHATAVVKERFGQASVLFAIDQLIKGAVRAITGLFRGLFGLLPIPGIQQVVRLVESFLRVAVGFVDEVILAYAIRIRSDNAWEASREALILYGQNYKAMLRNAAWLVLFIYGLSFLVFLVMLGPAALIAYLVPGGWSATGVIIAILLAWSVKAALLEPFAVTCMMQAFFKAIEGQEPDPEWEEKLERMSGKFRDLKAKGLSAKPVVSASREPIRDV